MATIGLIDVDGHNFPNLALMKISASHKSIGDTVEWYTPFNDYSIVYKAKVFTFTPDHLTYIKNADNVINGGTGYDITIKLDNKIEKCDPDYSIYPMHNYSLQLYSRGCIRKCGFCIVNKKEGKIRPVKPMVLNLYGKWIEVMDNNFFANPDWKYAIANLIKCGQPVNFHGIDVRIFNEEQAYWLNKVKLKKRLHIAWDNPDQDLTPQLKEFCKHIKAYKIMCYVLVGYNSTIEQDLYRIQKLREFGITPYVMPFDKSNNYQSDIARWVNGFIMGSCDFKDYSPRNNFKCKEYFNLKN